MKTIIGLCLLLGTAVALPVEKEAKNEAKSKQVTVEELITKDNFPSEREGKKLAAVVPPSITITSEDLLVKDSESSRKARKLVTVKDEDVTRVEDDKGTVITSESDADVIKVIKDDKVLSVNLAKDLKQPEGARAATEEGKREARVVNKAVPKDVTVQSKPIGVAVSPERKGLVQPKTLIEVDLKVDGESEKQPITPSKVYGGFRPITGQFPDFYYSSYYDSEGKPDDNQDTRKNQKRDGRQQFIGASADGKPIYYYDNQDKQATRKVQTLQQQQFNQKQHPLANAAIIPAQADSYIIKQHSFQMGPGGEVVDVPVPVPHSNQPVDLYAHYNTQQQQQQQQYQHHQQRPGYYGEPDTFFGRISHNIQKGINRMKDMVSPVMDPIQEAGEKITNNMVEAAEKVSHNLGIADKVDNFADKATGAHSHSGGHSHSGSGYRNPGVGGGEYILPIAAAGAALGLLTIGIFALSVGNYSSNIIELNTNNGKRSIDAPLETALDFIENTENLLGKRGSFADNSQNEISDDPPKSFFSTLEQYGVNTIRKSPCAKRIICDFLSSLSSDKPYLDTSLKRFTGLMNTEATLRLKDVLEAVPAGSCWQFSCGSHNVDSSRVPVTAKQGNPR